MINMKQPLRKFLKSLFHNIIKYVLKTRPSLLQPYLCNIDQDRDMVMSHFVTTLANCSDTSNINVCFNGIKLFVPAQTLLTMTHCVTFENSAIVCRVEQKHFMWLFEQVREFKGQTLFIDIGSASGAAVMTLAPRIPGLRTIAFEPSRKARTLLERMVRANNISGVTIYPFAVSDTVAEVPFIEYGLVDGAPAYRPETSSLFIPSALTPDAETYTVSCITLDHMFSDASQTHGVNTQVILKIDVEGFECHVLRGAQQYIKNHRPFLAIDIHSQPENPSETTRQECLDFLMNMGYSVQNMDHVLVAQPKQRGTGAPGHAPA